MIGGIKDMGGMFKVQKQGFTLIELLAVIVILAIVLAIALPSITGLIGNTTERAFLMDAKMVIKAIDYQLLEGYDLEKEPINDGINFEEVLNLSAKNYESVSVSLDENDEPYVMLVGQNKWEGLTVCGTFKDMKVGQTEEIVCEVPEDNFICGEDTILHGGYSYKTAKIDNQCWFAENLRYTDYKDEGGKSCLEKQFYSETKACASHTKDTDGKCVGYCNWEGEEVLYQWEAIFGDKPLIEESQGLCPLGWHIPSKDDWEVLIDGKSDVGNKLKAGGPFWDGSNQYKFNALPVGAREYDSGYLTVVGSNLTWWSSTSNNLSAWVYYVETDTSEIKFQTAGKDYGFSVRCLKN